MDDIVTKACWYFELKLLSDLTVVKQLARNVATDTVTESGSIETSKTTQRVYRDDARERSVVRKKDRTSPTLPLSQESLIVPRPHRFCHHDPGAGCMPKQATICSGILQIAKMRNLRKFRCKIDGEREESRL